MGGDYVLALEDKKLVAALRANSRTSVRAIAKQLGMPPSTAHDRIKRLCDKGILRHTTLVDFTKLGNSRMLVGIKATQNSIHRVQAFLQSSNNVNNAHRTEGRYDYFVELIGDAETISRVTDKLTAVEGVTLVTAHPLLEDVERERFSVGGSYDTN